MAEVEYSVEGRVAVIRLNRPEKLNAITYDMLADVERYIAAAGDDPAVRAVVFTGTGRAFSAGTDLNRVASDRSSAHARRGDRARAYPPERPAPWPFASIRKPTIAAINGVAVGIAVELAVQCDIRIAAESARVGWVFVHRGLVPDTGAGTWLLSRVVGLQNAAYLISSGEIIGAQRAKELGYLFEVVPDDALMDRALELANTLSRGAPEATGEAKRLLYHGLSRDSLAHLDDHREVMDRLFASDDFKEGVRSFLERRDPAWTGR